jgi:K(+)-stimulated pyrophosphate-energized sodium pump
LIELGLVFGLGLFGLGAAAYLRRWMLAVAVDHADMVSAAELIRRVANGFFRRQTSTIAALSAALAGVIFLAYGLLQHNHDEAISPLERGVWLTISFIVGASSAVVVAQVAVWSATQANARAASLTRRSLDHALQMAVRGGAVSGLVLVALGLLGVANLFVAIFAFHGGFGADPTPAFALAPLFPLLMAGHALGASFVALLSQVGGGTFAKAADLAADIASREAGLAEDAPRNPLTLVDLSGDVVGDGAGRATALFQSAATENLAAMMLGAALFRDNRDLSSSFAVILFPLVARALGLVGTVFGVMVVRTDDREDPLSPLARGHYVTSLLHALGIAGAAKWLLGTHWLAFFGCGAIGIALAVALFHVTQHFTEHRHGPLRGLAESARGGPSLVILTGTSVGLDSALVSSLLVLASAFGAYQLGAMTGLVHGGLFGIAVTALGMLGNAGYVMTMDAFGVIVDGASGIVELTIARERPDVRGRAVMLDAVGNTAKTLTRAYAACSAAFVAVLLIAVYLDETWRRALSLGKTVVRSSIDRPVLIAAALLGVLLMVWVASRSIAQLAHAARRLLDEARRQLRDIPAGSPPDHGICAEMAGRSALRQMLGPAVIVTVLPIGLGLALRLATTEDNPLLAADSVAALVTAGAAVSILGSLFLGNAGGAWDNAKKYILTGAHGGRTLVNEADSRTENPAFTAVAVGDAVGDPLKDASGPVLQALVKLLIVITIVFLPFFF